MWNLRVVSPLAVLYLRMQTPVVEQVPVVEQTSVEEQVIRLGWNGPK